MDNRESKTFDLKLETPIPEPIQQYMLNTMEALRNSCKRRKRSCTLYDQQLALENIKDLFLCYGACIFCAVNHTDSVEIRPFELFYLEIYLLSFIDIEESYSVEKSLSNKEEPPSEESEFAKLLIEYYFVTSKEPKVKFFMRQEIESLSFVLYDTSNDFSMPMLLFLLFMRNETKRYFDVFKELDIKTMEAFKLGILLKLEDEELKDVEELVEKVKMDFDVLVFGIKRYKSAIVIDPFAFFDKKEKNDDIMKYLKLKDFYGKIQDLKDKSSTFGLETLNIEEKAFVPVKKDLEEAKKNVYGSYFYKKFSPIELTDPLDSPKEFDDWVQRQVRRLNWRDCISMWTSNRMYDSKLVDSAMINVCIANKKFKEGWDIYNNDHTAKNACLSCIANLCLKALKNTGDENWTVRLSKIVKTVCDLKMNKECCEIASNSVPIICSISEEKRKTVMKTLIENIFSLTESDEIIFFALETLLRISTRCKSPDTSQLCINYAIRFYEIWKNHKKGFFFTKKGPYDADILCCMAGICTETENCNEFYKVCCDIKYYDTDIDYDTKIRLQKFHPFYHRDCQISKNILRCSKELISHYVKYKK